MYRYYTVRSILPSDLSSTSRVYLREIAVGSLFVPPASDYNEVNDLGASPFNQ